MKLLYWMRWLEFLRAALQVLSDWLPTDPFPDSRHLLLVSSQLGGWRFASPGSFCLKISSTAWQACNQTCSSLPLTDGPYLSPVDQVSERESYSLKSQIPSYDTILAVIHWSTEFDWSFQSHFLWPVGLKRRPSVLQTLFQLLQAAPWYTLDCSWKCLSWFNPTVVKPGQCHWCPYETTTVDKSM